MQLVNTFPFGVYDYESLHNAFCLTFLHSLNCSAQFLKFKNTSSPPKPALCVLVFLEVNALRFLVHSYINFVCVISFQSLKKWDYIMYT